MNECWKDIPGYEGLYQVSDSGQIKSLYFSKLRALVICGRGYKAVALAKCGIKKRYYVHRLVAYSFLGDPEGKDYEVNHKNCDKTDNRVENLEWVTRQENMAHAHENGLIDFRRKKRRDNTTGYPGISINQNHYQVSIGIRGKCHYVGFYKTLDEAIDARKNEEKRMRQHEIT